MSICGHSQGLGFKKLQFPLPQATLPTDLIVELCCHLHTLKHTMVISVVTPDVSFRYTGPLCVLQLTERQFDIVDGFMYCSLHCGSL